MESLKDGNGRRGPTTIRATWAVGPGLTIRRGRSSDRCPVYKRNPDETVKILRVDLEARNITKLLVIEEGTPG